MSRILAAAALLVLTVSARAADPTVKVEDKEPPKELGEAVRGVLGGKAMNVFDDKGKLLFTVWARKELAAKDGVDAKAGLKYANLEETTVLGAVRFPAEWVDYRKQKIKAGVYTLRLGIQPMDGDHMGTAPYSEFALLVPAEMDKKPELIDAKELHELSTKATTRKHPGLMLLFPNKKPADAPAIEAKPKEHWVLNYQVPVAAGAQKANLGFSLVVVGQTMAE
jgi:hypothetical protein